MGTAVQAPGWPGKAIVLAAGTRFPSLCFCLIILAFFFF